MLLWCVFYCEHEFVQTEWPLVTSWLPCPAGYASVSSLTTNPPFLSVLFNSPSASFLITGLLEDDKRNSFIVKQASIFNQLQLVAALGAGNPSAFSAMWQDASQ